MTLFQKYWIYRLIGLAIAWICSGIWNLSRFRERLSIQDLLDLKGGLKMIRRLVVRLALLKSDLPTFLFKLSRTVAILIVLTPFCVLIALQERIIAFNCHWQFILDKVLRRQTFILRISSLIIKWQSHSVSLIGFSLLFRVILILKRPVDHNRGIF